MRNALFWSCPTCDNRPMAHVGGKNIPVPLGQLIGKLIDPVIAKRGFANSALLAAWPDIVGERYARCSQPDQLKWPRRRDTTAQPEGGTLVVRVEGSRALLMMHEHDQLLERVNGFLGFRAVERVKIVQMPLRMPPTEQAEPQRPLDAESEQRLSSLLDGVENDALRKQLDKLGREVLKRSDKKS